MTHRYKYLLFLLLPDTHRPGVVVVIRFLNGSSFSTNALDLLRKLVYLLLSRLNELPREVIASTCLIRLTLVLLLYRVVVTACVNTVGTYRLLLSTEFTVVLPSLSALTHHD